MKKNVQRCALALTAVATLAITTACSESGSQKNEGPSAEELGLSGATGQLVGEGASSQQKAMDYFNVKYQATVPGASLAYTPNGSGSGQEQFINGQVTFAGSDSPLKDGQIADAAKRCGGSEAWHLPFVVGPVAVAYNVPGVGSLNLSTQTLAKIFKGDITNWNDGAIKAENAEATLPDKPITVIYRSDASGTTDNFQKFLKAVAPDVWDTTGKEFPASVGTGANGSSGVASEVGATEGAITYVESGFATEQGLGVANIDFGSGPVTLSPETVGAALDGLKFKGEGHNMIVDSEALFTQKEPGHYPLILTTYEIVCSDYSKAKDSAQAPLVKDFLTVALNNQNEGLAEQGFVPVSPDSAHGKRLAEAVKAIK